MTLFDDAPPPDLDDDPPGRMPPQDIPAEMAVLGAMLMRADIADDMAAELRPRDFYKPAHATVFAAVVALRAAGEPADVLTVDHHLRRSGDLDRVGGAPYLHTLIASVPTAENAPYYAGQIRNAAKLRRVIEAAVRAQQTAYAGTDDPDAVIDAVRADLDIADGARDATAARPPGDDLDAVLDHLARPEAETVIPTGFLDLDRALSGGFRPGQLIVVAGRPAQGKSVLALDIARHAAIRHGVRTLLVALEMTRKELLLRLLSAEAAVPLHHLRGVAADPLPLDDWERLDRVTDRVRAAPLPIVDMSALPIGVADIRRHLRGRDAPRLVVVDYLQLLDAPAQGRQDTRERQVARLTRDLKILAGQVGVPIVLLAQLNRGPEQRVDRRPVLSDLRESGAVEQDADVAILIHREDADGRETARAGEADLIVAKNRNGPPVTVTVTFQGHYARFYDIARHGEPRV